MKYGECPECGDTCLHDSWQTGRKLQQWCDNCDWRGEIRTPENEPIQTSKTMMAGMFGGFHYEIFDRYGHIMESSRYYISEEEAKEQMLTELGRGVNDKDAGPYIGLMWPARVETKARVYFG